MSPESLTSITADGPLLEVLEARIAKPLLVNDLDTVIRSRLVKVHVDTLLAEVAALLSSTQISLVVVCDAQGQAVGVITETILVRQLGFGKADVFTTRADDVMDRNFTACQPTDALAELLASMHQRGLMQVTVMDENKHPIGIFNARDGLRALLAQGHFEESLLRNYVMGVGYQ